MHKHLQGEHLPDQANVQLRFENVTFAYQQNGQLEPIVKNLSFTVYSGEFVSLVGPSGSGKSTLFRLITGLEKPLSGRISFPQWEREAHLKGVHSGMPKVGFMPQQDLLLAWRTALDNAILPLEIKGWPKKEAYDYVRPLFDEFGLSGTEGLYPHQLSGGMRQRVSFLRAVIASTVLGGPPLILLDEPFSALDAITRIAMQEWLLEQWMKRKQTIFFITHDLEEALYLSDRILLVEERPITHCSELIVPIGRPRNLSDLEREEMVRLKYRLLAKLKTKVTS